MYLFCLGMVHVVVPGPETISLRNPLCPERALCTSPSPVRARTACKSLVACAFASGKACYTVGILMAFWRFAMKDKARTVICFIYQVSLGPSKLPQNHRTQTHDTFGGISCDMNFEYWNPSLLLLLLCGLGAQVQQTSLAASGQFQV